MRTIPIADINFMILLLITAGVLLTPVFKWAIASDKKNKAMRDANAPAPKSIHVWMKGETRATTYTDIKDVTRYAEGWLRIDHTNNTKTYINLNNPDLDRFIVDYNEEM